PFVHTAAGKIVVCDLQPRHVTEFLGTKPTWSNGTRRCMISAIKAATNWGLEQGYISRNPLALLKRPASGVRDVSCVVTEDQHRLMLSQASPALADLLTVLWITGSRPGAVRVATAADLHGDRLVIVDRPGIKVKKVTIFLDEATDLCHRLAKANPDGPI